MTPTNKPIVLEKCSLHADGTVYCPIKKEILNDIQTQNIIPKKIIFEMEQ